MEKLWQFLMQANAKALFVIALATLLGVSAWRGWAEFAARDADLAPADPVAGRAEFKPGKDLGLIAFATAQLAATPDLPVNPFRPTLESLAADPAAFASLSPRGGGKPPTGNAAGQNPDPFAHLRGNRTIPGAQPTPAAQPAIPRLTYKGFFRRPDGQTAALFHDSAAQTAAFKIPGDTLRDATLIEADIRHATLRLANGEEIALAINESIELKPEPAKP